MGAITGIWLLALSAFPPNEPPKVLVTYYATEADCRVDLTKSINEAFNQLGGRVDFDAKCYWLPRRIGS